MSFCLPVQAFAEGKAILSFRCTASFQVLSCGQVHSLCSNVCQEKYILNNFTAVDGMCVESPVQIWSVYLMSLNPFQTQLFQSRLSVDIKPLYRKVGISEEMANKKIGKAFLHHHMILL